MRCTIQPQPQQQTPISHATLDEEYDYFTWIVSLRGATFYLRVVGAAASKGPILTAKVSVVLSVFAC